MRLWSLHPRFLDTKGLVALWREALLAKAVLLQKTIGYKNHPQLIRFKKTKDPISYINEYLMHVYNEAVLRGYKFNKSKIELRIPNTKKIPVTTGQVEYEIQHLKKKLKQRNQKCNILETSTEKLINPVFRIVKGDVENWEHKK